MTDEELAHELTMHYLERNNAATTPDHLVAIYKEKFAEILRELRK